MNRNYLILTATLIVCISLTVTAENNDFLLAHGRAGLITIGMKTSQVESNFGKDHVKQVDMQYEGMPSPALQVFFNKKRSEPALVLDLDGEVVYRINVADPRYRTKEGIGVGSSLNELQRKYHEGDPKEDGEGFYGIIDTAMGMSFSISNGTAPIVNSILVFR